MTTRSLRYINSAACLGGVILLGIPTTVGAADYGEGGADGSGPGPTALSQGIYWLPNCPEGTNADDYFDYDDYFGEVGEAGTASNLYEPPGSTYNNSGDVFASYHNYQNGHGIGAGGFFFMAGPGWSSPGQTPYNWGYTQGSYAYNDLVDSQVGTGNEYIFPFIYGDVEYNNPGDYGWKTPAQDSNWAADNYNVWVGFYTYLQNAGINVGAYSTTGLWQSIMNNHQVIQGEWTASQNSPGQPTPCPSGTFTGGPSGHSATFFNPQNSIYDFIWQWSQGVGADYDQIDISRINDVFGTSYVK